MKKRIFSSFLGILLALTASGQAARLYTSDDGLQNTQINRIRQDSRGSLWICTEGGLVRFDGQGFETFRHDRGNPDSISSESVHDIAEDRFGTRWVGTARGLDRFNADYNQFIFFDLQNSPLPPPQRSFRRIQPVRRTHSGNPGPDGRQPAARVRHQ